MRALVPLAALIGLGCTPGDDTGIDGNTDGCTTTGTALGQCAADFSLTSADGSAVALADHAGERVVILGSAAW